MREGRDGEVIRYPLTVIRSHLGLSLEVNTQSIQI